MSHLWLNFDQTELDFDAPPGAISIAVGKFRCGARSPAIKSFSFEGSYDILRIMDKDKLRHASIALSVKLVHLYDRIERRSFLKNQLARAGTSIGANLHEAQYAESSDDFVHKLRIALKECNECEYWLTILATSCPDMGDIAVKLRNEAGSIRRMLIASINTCLKSKEK